MNAKEPQPLPTRQDGKNESVLKKGLNSPVNVVRQPAPPPPPPPPKVKSK
ncbi:hypothetical protein FACS1894163_07630 [Spirochaetia bacterium]|nr:hypothetical protein FACS1894163_07630 [Spirochaetia bacterium]